MVTNNLRMHGAGVFHSFRLKSHAAFRARPWFGLADFGIHGANVGDLALGFRLADRFCFVSRMYHAVHLHTADLNSLAGRRLGRQILFWISLEFIRAALAAEVIGLSFVLGRAACCSGNHVHIANRIFDCDLFGVRCT
jgi:hypothetical protein